MNQKTVIALLTFVVLLVVVYVIQTRPEKGERTGERPRPLKPIDAKKIKTVSITLKGTTVELAREGKEKWVMTRPVRYPADKYAADTVVEKLEKLELGDLVTEQKSKHAEHEVDVKSGIHVVVSDGKATLADFYLGKVMDDFTLLRLTGKDAVYQAVGALRFAFDREVKGWRDRTIFDFKQEEARQVTLQTAEGTLVLSRPDEKTAWKVESSPFKIDQLDEQTVNDLLLTLYALNAHDFADDLKADKAGLDRPTATISVKLKDGKIHALKVGGTKDENTWVAREGAPQIFVLQKHTTDSLLKRPIDFRDKTVLSFKPEDVVSLQIEKKKEGETGSMTLTRKGADWMSKGKKVEDADKQNKIKDALEALSKLKAEGFAKDSASELGMDRPDWGVVIQLKDRTIHELSVGSKEKDGQRGLVRKGIEDLFLFRQWALDRFLLDPKDY